MESTQSNNMEELPVITGSAALNKPIIGPLRVPRIIAIEGLDGTGKESVAREVMTLANAHGIETKMVSFPRYGTSTGDMCDAYQRGKFGNPAETDPFLSAGLYTHDRLEWFKTNEFYQNLHGSQMLILDRSYYSNFIHQAMKCTSMRSLAQWMDQNFTTECEEAMCCWRGSFFETYYLELSEKDRLEQIESRDNLDEFETNNDYQSKCHRFIHFTRTHFFSNSLYDEFKTMGKSDRFPMVWDMYVRRVRLIPVIHASVKEDIPKAIRANGERILAEATRFPSLIPQEYNCLPGVPQIHSIGNKKW